MSTASVSALDALLAKHHVDLTSEDVLDELDTVFAAVPGAGAAPLSAAEVEFLREHTDAKAVINAWSADKERQSRSRTAVRELAQALSGSVSIKEAAATLGVDRSRVSRRITGSTLWAFDLRGSRRIPRWQFLGDGLLPGLDVVAPAIPRGTTPSVLDAFMRTAQPDFGDRPPIEYLAAGGDPTLVADFLADLARW